MERGHYNDQIVVRVERDGLSGRPGVHITGTTAGPAGEIVIDLLEGFVLAVDFARPDVLVSITIDDWTPSRDSGLLTELVGRDRSMRISEVVSETGQRSNSRPLRLDGDDVDPGSSLDRGRSNPGFAALVQNLGDLVDGGQPAILRLVAAGEAMEQVEVVAGGQLEMVIRRVVRDGVNDAVRRAERNGDDWLADLTELAERDRKLALSAARYISGIDTGIPPDEVRRRTESPFRRGSTADRLEHGISAYVAYSQMSYPDESRSPSWPFDNERKIAGMSPLSAMRLPEPRPTVHIFPAGRLRIRGEGTPDGAWLRVMDRHDMSVVAVVPVRFDDDEYEAMAVIPTAYTADDLIVETTHEPFPVRPTSSIGRVMEAIRLGREAATASADFRRESEAAELWFRCAEAWNDLGDKQRAGRAGGFARPNMRRGNNVTRRSPLVDRVRMALELPL